MKATYTFLDCTLRDGGYYNNWDFPTELINEYLAAVKVAGVDVVELGLRTLKNNGFFGACAFSTDDFLSTLNIPNDLVVAVMINANEMLGEVGFADALERLFPIHSDDSPVDLVRIACHVHEFKEALPAATWLKNRGYMVGFNLMQIADRTEDEIRALANEANQYPIDVLYFADSMGSMDPNQTIQIIKWLQTGWKGALGIHTHDNLGLALSNTLRALDEGCVWVDSTVTGMGRGPGNARTEELAIEINRLRGKAANLVPLMVLLRNHFKPMQSKFGWGTNPYYYLAGIYGIHPTFIQEMLGDSRYKEEDILAVIDYLHSEGGKKFSFSMLDSALDFYRGELKGNWLPSLKFSGKDVLILGTGESVSRHREAIERYIRRKNPLVLALNTQSAIHSSLIDLRIACHPVRLLADYQMHCNLDQVLILPYCMLPDDLKHLLKNKEIHDYGMRIEADKFKFGEAHCIVPTSQVIAYALAVATSGKANQILMAGFDGYGADDRRTYEMEKLLECYQNANDSLPLVSITPTRYPINTKSIYAL